VEIARRRLADLGLQGRGQAVVADFLQDVPTGPGVYLLSAVLADWSDARATRILARVARAAGPGGKVLVSEVNLPASGDAATDVLSTGRDLYIEATVTAPARTVEQVVDLAAAAGLTLTWTGPSTDVRTLLEFTVAPEADGSAGPPVPPAQQEDAG
jgi:hypothetical protein